MNHLSSVDRLANRFSVMRHGQSKANARGIMRVGPRDDKRDDDSAKGPPSLPKP